MPVRGCYPHTEPVAVSGALTSTCACMQETEVVVPEEQLQLTEAQLDEEVTKCVVCLLGGLAGAATLPSRAGVSAER